MNILQIEPILNLDVVDRIALREPIKNPKDVIQYLGELAVCHPVEQVFAVFLTENLRPISFMCGGVGNHHKTLVDVRGIVASALLLNSEAVILAHTHPSLSAKPQTPSNQDIETTKRLQVILSFFGMSLLDSFILEHCADNLEHLSLTSIINWIKDNESTPETEKSEQLVANI